MSGPKRQDAYKFYFNNNADLKTPQDLVHKAFSMEQVTERIAWAGAFDRWKTAPSSTLLPLSAEFGKKPEKYLTLIGDTALESGADNKLRAAVILPKGRVDEITYSPEQQTASITFRAAGIAGLFGGKARATVEGISETNLRRQIANAGLTSRMTI